MKSDGPHAEFNGTRRKLLTAEKIARMRMKFNRRCNATDRHTELAAAKQRGASIAEKSGVLPSSLQLIPRVRTTFDKFSFVTATVAIDKGNFRHALPSERKQARFGGAERGARGALSRIKSRLLK